jgi:hypothetical protein
MPMIWASAARVIAVSGRPSPVRSTGMRTRLTALLLSAGFIAGAAPGCAWTQHSRSSAGHRPPCAHPAKHELGFVRSTDGPWPSFHSAGGDVYVGVRGLGEDTLFGKVRQTRASLVDLTQEPQFRPDSSAVLNATVNADVHEHRLTKVQLPAGQYWVVSSNYGNLWLETCSDDLVSDVLVAQPATDAG